MLCTIILNNEELNVALLQQECHNSKLDIFEFWYRKKRLQMHFKRCRVIMQFPKLAAGEQMCRRCTHRKL